MQIDGWDWDDDNLSHLGGRGLGRQAVLQVAQEAPKFRENLKGRAATHQMIGPDSGGAIWVVCIVQTPREGIWRAITGWRAEPEDEAWYRRQS